MNQFCNTLISVILVLVPAVLVGCGGNDTGGPSGGSERSVVVDAEPVSIETVEDSIELVGSLESRDQTHVSSEVAGVVRKIHYEEGQKIPSELNGSEEAPLLVTLNDDLFQIAVQNARAKLDTARTKLEQARDSFRRQEQMYENDATSEAAYTRAELDYQQAKAEKKRAEAELARMKERLRKTRIRAPIQGVLGERLVSPGTYVRPGDPLVEVTKLHPIEVSFDVPEKYRRRLEKGLSVNVELEAYPQRTFEGTVFFVSPTTDRETRTITVKARMDNSKYRLQPGMFARIQLVLDTREEAHVVPETAVVPRNKKTFVYTVQEGRANKQEVTLGQRMPGKVEIRSGLDGDETVIFAGLQMVSDGVPVRIREQE